MFKGVSLCIPTVSILIEPLLLLPLTPLPPIPQFQQLSIHIFVYSTFTDVVLWYYWCPIILFSFSFFPEFHRVVTL
jgi:hypothetical protein